MKKSNNKKKLVFWKVGKNYFIRTVTHHLMGTLISFDEKEFILKNASWIADDGRFHKFLVGDYTSSLEVEPFPKEMLICVGRGSLIDAVEWTLPLLREPK